MTESASALLTQTSFVTAGGTETYLLFQQQFALREFCAFEIYEQPQELAKLERDYLHPLMTEAARLGHGLLLDALVWRAHPDYVAALGYPESALERINRNAVARTRFGIEAWRAASGFDREAVPVLVAADIGPRGDGYSIAGGAPGVDEAYDYHRRQLDALAGAEADVVCALTMTNANEAIGIVRAAAALDVPVIVSPTVETDGRLPDGSSLRGFVETVDAATAALPLCYLVNCAHPTHLAPTLEAAASRAENWLARLKGFSANASRKSHAELDNSTELDRGDPEALAAGVGALQRTYGLNIVGGCCGTDHEHIAAIARATSAGLSPRRRNR